MKFRLWDREKSEKSVTSKQICEFAVGLSISAAYDLAKRFLQDSRYFEMHPLSEPLPEHVTGTSRDAFIEFGSIVSLETNLELGPGAFGESNYFPGAYRIGFDMDFTEYVLVPGFKGVLWIDESGYEHPDGMKVEYPSVCNIIVESHMFANRSKLSAADLLSGSDSKIADW